VLENLLTAVGLAAENNLVCLSLRAHLINHVVVIVAVLRREFILGEEVLNKALDDRV